MSQLNDHLRIHVADDSPVWRKQLERAFLNQPYEVLFPKDGREALEAVSHHRPHIVITDWMMPDLSGPELCQKIRNQLQDGYTYIILLTSNSEKDSVVEGLAAGADDYLTKPFRVPELLARIGVGRRIIEMNREIQARGSTQQSHPAW